MVKKDNAKKSKSEKSKSAPKSVDLSIGGDMKESVAVIGDNNVVNYYEAVSTNTEKHEPDYWNLKHPYPMPPNFTGRIAERATLTQWLNEDSENRLFILRALGGFGKSALTWQWLTHDVDIKEWPKVVFWSFYEGDASFENFIAETLKYLKLEVPQGGRPQVDELLKAMQKDNLLLIMDGFERALRAYSSMNATYQGDEEPKLEDNQLDCININAEWFLKGVCSNPKIKSKVLMTTRLTPSVVKPHGEFILGCREVELKEMQKADAVEFFHKQKIKGTHAEIEAACAPYGYHPLSLRLLAGRILKDFENPADIVVAQKLKIDGDIKQQKHHVLEVSYNSLSPHEQKLLSTIACFRSPVELETLEAIVENRNSLNDDLHDLVERGLLHFDDKNKKFDLHPIVRRFAYNRLLASEQTGVHIILVAYFEAVPLPPKVEKLEDLAPVIELYHHMVRAGKLDEAIVLFRDRLNNTLYFQLGAYQIIVELLLVLFVNGEDKPPQLKDEEWQAWTLNALANSYSLRGQPRRAVPLHKRVKSLKEKTGNKREIAVALGTMAFALLLTGALKEAERSLRHQIDLCLETNEESWEALGHMDLGHVLSHMGALQEAEEELDKSIVLFIKLEQLVGLGVSWSLKAYNQNFITHERMRQIEFALIKRFFKNFEFKLTNKRIQYAVMAQNEWSEQNYPIEREKVRNWWLFGRTYRAHGDLTEAEENLSTAIRICRQINLFEMEANILLDLARLRYDQKKYEEAKSLADEALTITERCGYVLQGADVNLFLAQYSLEQEKDKVKAKEYAESALKLAHCDDGPPYYYKVAYEEAVAMLERLKV